MPFYLRRGDVPDKRHVQFRQPDGSLFHEQLFGTVGFSGMSSLLYHINPPTRVVRVEEPLDDRPVAAVENNISARKLVGFDVPPVADHLAARVPMMFNDECTLRLAAPTDATVAYFYKNSDSDEVVFVHEGAGVLHSMFGDLRFEPGDYLVIPRGVIHSFEFDTDANRLLVIESRHPIYTPKRYRNHFGQMLESSPFCERDIRTPVHCDAVDAQGEFEIKVRKQGQLHSVIYLDHPYNVVGWDGYHFPYAFNISNFEPITGRVHLPPPTHQTFESDGFVICSFVPRMYDYHPQSIPAPYNHSNIDSDEVLYYVAGNFMSRKDIGPGYVTLHPAGVPHGPHPGTYEASVGKKETKELAVMVDTFRPLKLTQQALDLESGNYGQSWLPGAH